VTLQFDDSCLVPRPWTIEQSNWAATVPDIPPGPILELCAGVGQIGLIAAMLTGRRLVQVDRNRRACEWARINAEQTDLADRVEIRHGDMEHAVAVDERFAIILADPPYVPTSEVALFDDPVMAIDGGRDGLDLAWGCMQLAEDHLDPGGLLSVQLRGREQAAALLAMYQRSSRLGLVPDGVRAWGSDRAVAHYRAVAQCPSTGWGT
jgi:release factor glutamine methyltransferase